MWLLLTIVLNGHAVDLEPRYLGMYAHQDACQVAASKWNGPDPENLRIPRTDKRFAICFRAEYPT